MRERLIIGSYRFGNWVLRRVHVPIARQLLLTIAHTFQTLVVVVLHSEIPISSTIGRRLHLPHGGHGVVVASGSVIGDDVYILQHVALSGTPQNSPVIVDLAMICVGAVIIGGVHVGSDAVVGANSVVLDDVPARATVVGAPGARSVRGSRPVAQAEVGSLLTQSSDPIA